MCFIIVFNFISGNAQITITIISVPKNSIGPYYAAGTFNDWNPADPNFMFYLENNVPTLSFIPANTDDIEFKITRGSWETVETMLNGKDIPNRQLMNAPGVKSWAAVNAWHDMFTYDSVALNPDVIHFDIYSPQLETEKHLRILLPIEYIINSKNYPVIYMMDGQNLFDEATSFAGEWEIDEMMHNTYTDQIPSAIIVGIDNAGADRTNEYLPWKDSIYGGGDGDAFIDFIVETLKPFIDSTYRTKSYREQTYIAGSSLGGLMSLYAVLRNNDVFGNAFVFSPAFWIAQPLFTVADTTIFSGPTYLYFIAGGKESETMEPEMNRMYEILKANKDANGHYRYVIEADAQHNEIFWRKEFPVAYKWFLKNKKV
ncbi:MAG: alpha/beta hydrolase [Bacteroidetes bacterium]|nr:alpha/beta hydrolase [Bacteroidota bacterium]